jgi:hypothetical protein
MKGGFDIYLTVGTLLFATAIVTMWITVQTYYIDFAGVVKIPVENIEVVESAHAVESCLARLSASERFISKDVLEEYRGDSINRICEIQEPVMWASVEDIETKAGYLFPPPDKDILEKLFPPAMVNDFIEKIRRWTDKDIKTEHSIWVSVAIPETKKITDKTEKLTGEFLVQARWEGLGSLKANDVILKLYKRDYYKILPFNVQTISPSEVRRWLEDMEDDGVKFDSRIVKFQDTPVTDIIPHELVDCDKVRILDLVDSEACVEIFEKINEIHMGRLGVKI